MQTSYVALLRGINLASKNRLPMKTLEKMFSDAGCDGVRSYIQSGNVLFRANKTLAGKLSNHIKAQILESFGFRIPVILRSAEQMAETVNGNPFVNDEAMTDMLHVMFLANQPSQERIAALDHDRFLPDEFVVRGAEIYLRLPTGVARSKLTNAYFDSKLTTVSTSRNWRTVNKLLEMMQQ
jgi:uncharacterized protein (DUF1697 family)